ncbi:hypothetical protein ACA910_013666 [Epithemia clementina (nom. ined.)]
MTRFTISFVVLLVALVPCFIIGSSAGYLAPYLATTSCLESSKQCSSFQGFCGIIGGSQPPYPAARRRVRSKAVVLLRLAPSWNDNDSGSSSSSGENSNIDNDGGGDDDDDDAKLFQSLRDRADEIAQKTRALTNKWKTGDCKSTLPLALPDWVRRIDVDYPLVACGSSQETVYLGHLETGQIIAQSHVGGSSSSSSDEEELDNDDDDEEQQEGDRIPDIELEQTLRYMFGSYDGGGTLSIAFQGSLICEGTRQGGVRIWRVDPSTKTLVSQGSIPALNGRLATCLHLDQDDVGTNRLWVGTHDGEIHLFRMDNPLKPLALQTTPHYTWTFGKSRSCILSMHFCPDFHCGVAALGGGSVQLFSTTVANPNSNEQPTKTTTTIQQRAVIDTLYPPFESSSERRSAHVYPTHACLVQTKLVVDDKNDSEITGLTIVCGGSDGSMDMQKVAITEHGEIDLDRPFQEPIQAMGQGHLIRGSGLIKAMVSPSVNMLVSLGQDGCMRVWDVLEKRPFYSFQGYKVWTGSLWTDGRRLVSDGVDNTILMHDFGESEDEAA